MFLYRIDFPFNVFFSECVHAVGRSVSVRASFAFLSIDFEHICNGTYVHFAKLGISSHRGYGAVYCEGLRLQLLLPLCHYHFFCSSSSSSSLCDQKFQLYHCLSNAVSRVCWMYCTCTHMTHRETHVFIHVTELIQYCDSVFVCMPVRISTTYTPCMYCTYYPFVRDSADINHLQTLSSATTTPV